MVKILFAIGILLLFPGCWTLYHAFSIGPASWALDQTVFWGTPIVNFVFWIGLAHAGTFLSAILLLLGARFQKRISFIAELSTVSSIFVAGLFPLIHLGVISRFYFLVPFFNQRDMYVNFASPLVWDFLAIGVYAFLSIAYLIVHIVSLKHPSLSKTRRAMAWVLFPLVLWVHTIVSLDFAVSTVPLWRGGFLPIYFIAGAIFSGLALVMLLLESTQGRGKKLEEMLLAGSWLLLAFWIWEFLQKGVWHPEVIFFGFLVVQSFWITRLREKKIVRLIVGVSVLVAMWWERFALIMHSDIKWLWSDWGWFALGAGLFLFIFFGLYLLFQKIFPELFLVAPQESRENAPQRQVILIVVFSFMLASFYLFLNHQYDPGVPWVQWVPAFFPIAALIAGLSFFVLGIYPLVPKKYFFFFSGLVVIFVGFAAGAFYAGGNTDLSFQSSPVSAEFISKKERPTSYLWNSRCVSCHGSDGLGNRKFIYEFYPEPQDLTLERLVLQGEDSLTRVVLEGRAYMNPFEGRLSEPEARALIRYMHQLAEDKE